MKKILILALFAALIFIVSCDGGGGSERKAGELYGECYGNGTCNEGLVCEIEDNVCVRKSNNSGNNDDNTTSESSDSAPNDTDTDSGDFTTDEDTDTDTTPADPCDPNPCTGIANSTENCNVSGTSYVCGCNSGYNWTGSQCVKSTTPCNPNPCTSISNSTGVCTVSGTSYVCGCNSDYDWTGSQCVKQTTPCNPNPCTSISNSTGVCTVSGTSYVCGCNSGYDWTGSQCQSNSTPSLPECSTADVTPCYDSTSHLTWSKKSSSTMTYSDATSYCSGSEMNGYGGYSDWRLPNISELRTLIKNCSGTQMPGGSCGVVDTGNSSTSCLSGRCQGEDCYPCSYDSTGGHSKFGETGYFWYSSTLSDIPDYAWQVLFHYGSVINSNKSYGSDVRCVR